MMKFNPLKGSGFNLKKDEMRKIYIIIACICWLFFLGNIGFAAKFLDNENGTILDVKTDLTWQQQTKEELNWKEAISYCDDLSLGFGTWRLPTILELQTLIKKVQGYPSIDTVFFPETTPALYQSITIPTYSFTHRYAVNFSNGTLDYTNRYRKYRVRCVK